MPRMPNLVRSACLTAYPKLARSLGLDPLRMLDACGIEKRLLENPDLKMPLGKFLKLLEMSARVTGVDDFGLRLSETRTPEVLGPIGLLVREEGTLRDLLHSAARYLPLHVQRTFLHLEERDDEAIISESFGVEPQAPMRQFNELAIGFLYRMLRSLAGPQWRPLVCFTHQAPDNSETHRRVFGGHVAFGREFNGIVCARRDLDRTVSSANPMLARYVRESLETELRRTDDDFAGRVSALVYLEISSGRCTAERISRRLGIDRSTMRRWLARENTSFSAVVDLVRGELVGRMLPTPAVKLEFVAAALGFSSLSAFSRWFRGRFHQSASQWRRSRTAARRGPRFGRRT